MPAVGDFAGLAKKVMTSNSGKAPDVVLAVGSYSNIALGKRSAHRGRVQGPVHRLDRIRPAARRGGGGCDRVPPDRAREERGDRAGDAAARRRRAEGGAAQPIDPAVIAGYLSADVFLQVLAQRPTDLSPATFLNAANRYTYEVPGVVGPTKFPKARTQPTPCGSLVQSDGTTFAVKVPYTCSKVVQVG